MSYSVKCYKLYELVVQNFYEQQFEQLSQFISKIEATPELRREVSCCSSFDELVSIANNGSIRLTNDYLKFMKRALAAFYWPWRARKGLFKN